MLQKRTVSFDIIYDDAVSTDPFEWDFVEGLDLFMETLRNLQVVPAVLTDEDRQAHEKETGGFDDED